MTDSFLTNAAESAALFPDMFSAGCNPEASVRQVLDQAQDVLNSSGILSAEAVLFAAAEIFIAGKHYTALELLRGSVLYSTVLTQVQVFEQGAGTLLESLEGWDLVTSFRVGYRAMGLDGHWQEAIGQNGDLCQIFAKVVDTTIDVKLITEFPSFHPTLGTHYLSGYIGMWYELDLWHAWHPVIVGDGPTPLLQHNINQNEWEERFKIAIPLMSPVQEAAITENYNFFDFDQGIVYQSMQALGDEDDQTRRMPPPGYRRFTTKTSIRNLVICQQSSHAVIVGVTIPLETAPAGWMVRLVCRWLVPAFAKNLFKTGFGIACAGPYVERFREDRHGLYSILRRIYEAGASQEVKRGFKYRPGRHSSMAGFPGPDTIFNRKHSLVALERELKKNR